MTLLLSSNLAITSETQQGHELAMMQQQGVETDNAQAPCSDRSHQRMGRAPKRRTTCSNASIKFQEWSTQTWWASAFTEEFVFLKLL